MGSGAKKRGACFDKGRGFGAEAPPPSPKKRGGEGGVEHKNESAFLVYFCYYPHPKKVDYLYIVSYSNRMDRKRYGTENVLRITVVMTFASLGREVCENMVIQTFPAWNRPHHAVHTISSTAMRKNKQSCGYLAIQGTGAGECSHQSKSCLSSLPRTLLKSLQHTPRRLIFESGATLVIAPRL